MIGFTKERIEQFIKNPLEHGLTRSEQMEMARQLLTSMEQEPVADVVAWHRPTEERTCDIRLRRHDIKPGPLYAEPQLPQPGVETEHSSVIAEQLAHVLSSMDVTDHQRAVINCAVDRLNKNAAMLGAEPVSQPDELPLDYRQGHKDGLEWAARLAEANHPQTGDWLYDDPLELAKAIRKGPDMPTAPVQGWIPCSERMPEEVGRYWCYVEEQNSLGKSHYQWNCSWNGDRWWVESENGGRVTHWMPLPAAPQQEVK